ncbi:MAG: hypothetical protein LC632_04165 [Xanthomonadaceae bacterium]|nr:hypothetical protein [Xanthomonadaceae bacterium]
MSATLQRLLTMLAVAACIAVPGAARAQSPWIAPSVAIGIAYDDNITASEADPQSDLMLRVTPSLEAGFRSARGEGRFLHTFDAEKYRDSTNLDSAQVRRYTELQFDYRVTPRLDAALLATTAASDFADDLAPEFGLELGRVDSRRTSIAPELEYRFTPRTSGLVGLEIERDQVVSGITADTRGAFIGAAYRATPRTTWSVDLIRRQYSFDPGGDAHSNIVLLGWTGQVSPRATLSIHAGPRMTEVDTRSEVLIGYRYDIPGGEFSAGYQRTERTIIGQASLAEAGTLWLLYAHPITPSLALRLVPSYTALSRGDASSNTAGIALAADYRFTPLISLTSSYRWTQQDGSLERGPVDITRNVVFFGMTVAFSPRVGQTPPADIRRRNR